MCVCVYVCMLHFSMLSKLHCLYRFNTWLRSALWSMNTLHACFNWDSKCQPRHKILHPSATVVIAASLLRWINEAFRHFLFHEVCCYDCGVFTCAIIAKLPSQLVMFYREHNRTSRPRTHSGRRTRAGCHRRYLANNIRGQNRPWALGTQMPLFCVQ
jgi:hypothetical protein